MNTIIPFIDNFTSHEEPGNAPIAHDHTAYSRVQDSSNLLFQTLQLLNSNMHVTAPEQVPNEASEPAQHPAHTVIEAEPHEQTILHDHPCEASLATLPDNISRRVLLNYVPKACPTAQVLQAVRSNVGLVDVFRCPQLLGQPDDAHFDTVAINFYDPDDAHLYVEHCRQYPVFLEGADQVAYQLHVQDLPRGPREKLAQSVERMVDEGYTRT